MEYSLRIAHLSDPHFSHVSYHPNQFLSKRWIGNCNLMFFRKYAYQTEHLWHLPKFIHSLKVEAAFITGDFSATSLDKEFSEGRRFVDSFKECGIQTFAVPGNHDCYTKKAQKDKRFYSFFSSESLKEKRVECISLGKNWWYIGLDCAVASPPFCSYGNFLETTEKILYEILLTIPDSDSVIIGNHFPLFATESPLHNLKRAVKLQNIFKTFRQVKLYLHGHDHQHYILDRQNEGLPLVINSGSCAHKPNGIFYLIDLFKDKCLIQRFLFRKENFSCAWVIDWQKYYELRRI